VRDYKVSRLHNLGCGQDADTEKQIAKNALEILINLSTDREVLQNLATDKEFMKTLLGRVTVSASLCWTTCL